MKLLIALCVSSVILSCFGLGSVSIDGPDVGSRSTVSEPQVLAEVTAAQATTTISWTNNFVGIRIDFAEASKIDTQTTVTLGTNQAQDLYTNQVLYVFTEAFTSVPSSIPLSANDKSEGYLARAECKDGNTFLFPASVKFSAAPHYFYLSKTVSGVFPSAPKPAARSDFPASLEWDPSDDIWMVYDSSIVFSIKSTANDGSGGGDPYFIGFNNQKFEFDGEAGSIYNIYNDPYMNFNAKLSYSNKKQTGTVMTQFGISIGGHNISIDINDFKLNEKDTFWINIDGLDMYLDKKVIGLSGCVDLQFKGDILITTPKHDIFITPRTKAQGHISVHYLDLHIHHPEEDNSKIGGVLGQTAQEFNVVDTDPQDFVVASIYSVRSQNFYNFATLEC